MDVQKDILKVQGVRFSITDGGREVGRATLYVLTNDLHDRPFGLLEDVFVSETVRGQGIGTELYVFKGSGTL